MAQATTAVRMTPLARLLDTVLRNTEGVNLPTYLARHRAPGPGWQTYDQLAEQLTELSGHQVNRVTLKTFTESLFGIPDTRYVESSGKRTAMPRAVDTDAVKRYIAHLNPLVIDSIAVANTALPTETEPTEPDSADIPGYGN
jgi:hypothetical protein